MKVVVISCFKYRDAWEPFFALFKKFWPDCPYDVYLLTDRGDQPGTPTIAYNRGSWCEVLTEFLNSGQTQPVLLMQEDFFLTAPVNQTLIYRAQEQFSERAAGMIRLYPCPGAMDDYGDKHYGSVAKGTPYRISCQAAIWRWDYLRAIASRFKTASEFETYGTEFANQLAAPILAFRREVTPWPLEYLCSGITRGKWSPDAKLLCDLHGLTVDWSQRASA